MSTVADLDGENKWNVQKILSHNEISYEQVFIRKFLQTVFCRFFEAAWWIFDGLLTYISYLWQIKCNVRKGTILQFEIP